MMQITVSGYRSLLLTEIYTVLSAGGTFEKENGYKRRKERVQKGDGQAKNVRCNAKRRSVKLRSADSRRALGTRVRLMRAS